MTLRREASSSDDDDADETKANEANDKDQANWADNICPSECLRGC